MSGQKNCLPIFLRQTIKSPKPPLIRMNKPGIPRVEVWSKNNVSLAVSSGEKKNFSPHSADSGEKFSFPA